MTRTATLSFVLPSLLAAAFALPVNGEVIYVPADFPTIQAAVDAAAVGDEVRILPGTYTGAGNKYVDFHGKDLAVIGEGGPEVTIIDCEYQGLAFRLDSGETNAARIEGLTIRTGFIYMEGDWMWGAGIGCLGASPTIRNCVIENCSGREGGGIFMHASSPTVIADCVIRGNSVGQPDTGDPGRGGGMALSGPITVTGCQIVGNRALEGMASGGSAGGIVCGSGVRLEGCLIAENEVRYFGVGGGVVGTNFTMVDCVIRGNSVLGGEAGGLLIHGTSSIEGCLIAGNASTGGGAGILCADQGNALVSSCTITRNHGGTDGGGILCATGARVHLERTILWGNCSDIGAAEAYLEQGTSLEILCSDLDGSGTDGPGSLIDLGDNIEADPLFCDPADCQNAPTPEGDYGLHADSPCLPPGSPCGERIGSTDVACGPTATRETSWGRLKASYH